MKHQQTFYLSNFIVKLVESNVPWPKRLIFSLYVGTFGETVMFPFYVVLTEKDNILYIMFRVVEGHVYIVYCELAAQCAIHSHTHIGQVLFSSFQFKNNLKSDKSEITHALISIRKLIRNIYMTLSFGFLFCAVLIFIKCYS